MSEQPKVLERYAPWDVTETRDTGDGLTLEGYAAVFDTPTRIDSWEGKFDEQIARGAFRKTIRERTPVMQFDHGHDTRTGSVPIGSIELLREDKQGLFVRARLFDNDLVRPIRDAIAGGALSGMSFRFNVVKDEWDDSADVPSRTIREVRLHELGPVVFPAYPETTVGVRAEDLSTAPAASGTDDTPDVPDEPQDRTRPSHLSHDAREAALRDLDLWRVAS